MKNELLEDPEYKAFLGELSKEELIDIIYSDFQNRGLPPYNLFGLDVKIAGMSIKAIMSLRRLYLMHNNDTRFDVERIAYFAKRIKELMVHQ